MTVLKTVLASSSIVLFALSCPSALALQQQLSSRPTPSKFWNVEGEVRVTGNGSNVWEASDHTISLTAAGIMNHHFRWNSNFEIPGTTYGLAWSYEFYSENGERIAGATEGFYVRCHNGPRKPDSIFINMRNIDRFEEIDYVIIDANINGGEQVYC